MNGLNPCPRRPCGCPGADLRGAEKWDATVSDKEGGGGGAQVQRYRPVCTADPGKRVGGIVVAPDGHLRTVISCTVERHRITKMEVIADPERLRRLNLAVFPD